MFLHIRLSFASLSFCACCLPCDKQTLAETTGGAASQGHAAVGLSGTIPVVFEQGNNTEAARTMALSGQPLSEVAAQAGQFIKYKCRKGECGTCEVRVDGQWIRTCTATVPFVELGSEYRVHVRASMAKAKKSSRFFSPASFVAGFKNNVLGMVGFVREGRKSESHFRERIVAERALMEQVKARKAARDAGKTGGA